MYYTGNTYNWLISFPGNDQENELRNNLVPQCPGERERSVVL